MCAWQNNLVQSLVREKTKILILDKNNRILYLGKIFLSFPRVKTRYTMRSQYHIEYDLNNLDCDIGWKCKPCHLFWYFGVFFTIKALQYSNILDMGDRVYLFCSGDNRNKPLGRFSFITPLLQRTAGILVFFCSSIQNNIFCKFSQQLPNTTTWNLMQVQYELPCNKYQFQDKQISTSCLPT